MWAQLLDTQVPLKQNEKHCVYCSGYGANPVNKNDNTQTKLRNTCLVCDGAGKFN